MGDDYGLLLGFIIFCFNMVLILLLIIFFCDYGSLWGGIFIGFWFFVLILCFINWVWFKGFLGDEKMFWNLIIRFFNFCLFLDVRLVG